MLTRPLILLTLVLGTIIFLTGAWTGSLVPLAQNSESTFVAQFVPLDSDIIGSGIDATGLLAKAVEKLKPGSNKWLKTKIRQTMTDTDSNFIAEGFLQRGPNHCARLELDIASQNFLRGEAAKNKGRLLVVSDGAIIAQARTRNGATPDVTLERLPADDNAAAREMCLTAKGCGGPVSLLRPIQQHLRNGKLQTGLLDQTRVIRITGDVDPKALAVCANTTIPVRSVNIYLDAHSLWPCRLEWRGLDKQGTERTVLRIEYLAPEIDQELVHHECVRLFSYRPH